MRVAVRVRPLLSFEKTERLGECLSCIPQSKQLCVGDGGDNGRNAFTFDFTFPKACEQRSLYDDCVASLLEGGDGMGWERPRFRGVFEQQQQQPEKGIRLLLVNFTCGMMPSRCFLPSCSAFSREVRAAAHADGSVVTLCPWGLLRSC